MAQFLEKPRVFEATRVTEDCVLKTELGTRKIVKGSILMDPPENNQVVILSAEEFERRFSRIAN